MACNWPPWYTTAVWKWLQSLQWTVRAPTGRAPCGVAYVELLVDFVYKTGLCPPVGLEAARTYHETRDEPVTIRQYNHILVETVRQLERLSGTPVWPARRGKVFALRALGCSEARIGLSLRRHFASAEEVLKLLQFVLTQSSVLPFCDYCRGPGFTPSTGDESLHRVWSCFSPSERAKKARPVSSPYPVKGLGFRVHRFFGQVSR